MKATNQIINLVNKVFFTSLLVVLTITSASAQNDWKLSADKEGIKVYTSIVPDSKIKAVKVECDLNTTPSQLVSVVMDINTATDWVYHVKSAKLVKQVSPSELYYYSEVSLPWPAANRDFVAHLTVSKDPVTKVVTIDGPAVSGYVPIKRGVVRIDNSSGKWVITPISTSQVHVQYSIHVDPGGSLPAWLVNLFATDAPLKIFEGLKVQLQKPAYKNTAFAFVEN
ncbi:MAG: START domain-containing protein [Mucilaginibacter sp.]|nr:START domain-containing protein [Mucilaginibacter sp.]